MDRSQMSPSPKENIKEEERVIPKHRLKEALPASPSHATDYCFDTRKGGWAYKMQNQNASNLGSNATNSTSLLEGLL